MAQNKIIFYVLIIFLLGLFVLAISFGVGYCITAMDSAEKAAEYHKIAEKLQADQEHLLAVEEWYNEDGYTDATQWWLDYRMLKKSVEDLKNKIIVEENEKYFTEEQSERLKNIEQEYKDIRSIKKLKELFEELNLINEAITEQKEIEENENIEEYNIEEENIYNYNSYNVSSNGLTPQSGVNEHNGRTETYYSSNVLYHRDTSNWIADDEGFYRTSEGYYVVAASDMSQGTVFETSKGTAIVLDSGCNNGVTDFYVNW